MIAILKRAVIRVWGVLTSMRTALVLLFFLALAAVPGATLPQRDVSPQEVIDYHRDHPTLAPIFERLSLFDVFAAPWFAAIYLLLMISVVGCLSTRLPAYIRQLRAGPPRVPKRLDRLPQHAEIEIDSAEHAREVLKKRRWGRTRTVERDNTIEISTEKGRLREAGNLTFHTSLIVVLVGVAIGSVWGFTGGMVLLEDSELCNTVQNFDTYEPGALVADDALPPLCVQMNDFRAEYTEDGQALSYAADLRYADGADAASKELEDKYTLEVNEPLRFEGAGMFLLNHGYAPILRYTDRFGTVFESPTVFLPQDDLITSEGVVALPDANQDPESEQRESGVEVAFEGVYMPTVPVDGLPVSSAYPERLDEGITLVAYRGTTGVNDGKPRSVYTLDQKQISDGELTPVGSRFLRPGEAWELDDGTKVEFIGSRQWISVRVAEKPGQLASLVGAGSMVAGVALSLMIRRRRVFLRVRESDDGTAHCEIGGLDKTDSPAFEREFAQLVAALSTQKPELPAPREEIPDGDRESGSAL